MDMDEYELEREASAPIDMLETYFSALGWAYERNGEDEIVSSFQGSWTQYELRAIWRAEDQVLQFLALPDIRVAPEKRAATYETIGLINEQLWLGHFEFWSASGLVLFRHAALLEGDESGTLSLQQAETLVEAAIEECERFYPVFQFVLWADKTPAGSDRRRPDRDAGRGLTARWPTRLAGPALARRLRQYGRRRCSARWLEEGVDPAHVSVIRPSGAPCGEGVRVTTAYPEDEVPAIVLLGDEALSARSRRARRWRRSSIAETILVSILAGVELASLRARFARPRTIIRAMPNLPVRIGKGAVGLYQRQRATWPPRALITGLMAALGHAEWFEDETPFQLAGHLTGAGPAFLFRFIDALAAAAERLGLPYDQAQRLARARWSRARRRWPRPRTTIPRRSRARSRAPAAPPQAGLAMLDADRRPARSGRAHARGVARAAAWKWPPRRAEGTVSDPRRLTGRAVSPIGIA